MQPYKTVGVPSARDVSQQIPPICDGHLIFLSRLRGPVVMLSDYELELMKWWMVMTYRTMIEFLVVPLGSDGRYIS